MVAAAVIGAGVLAAGATTYASSQATSAQKSATATANNTQTSQYNQTRADNMPALDARNASLSKLQDLLGISGNTSATGYGSLGGSITPQNVQNDPGYQFGLTQGQTALSNSEVARGMSNSGQALKAASQYGTDYATTKYNDAFNRSIASQNAQLQPLESVAGLGQSGASTVAAAGTSSANAISGNQSALGNSIGASYIANGATVANTANQLSGWYQAQPQTTSQTPLYNNTSYGGSGSTLYGDGYGPQ